MADDDISGGGEGAAPDTSNVISMSEHREKPKKDKKDKKATRSSNGREVFGLVPNVRDVVASLKKWEELAGLVYFDTFSNRMMRNAPIPGSYRGSESFPVRWSDKDTVSLLVYMNKWFPKLSERTLDTAVTHVAHGNERSSAQMFFNGLDPWDGVSRIDDFFVTVCNIDKKNPQYDYVRRVSRKIFIGIMARVFRPGCKLETVPILEGAQGIMKSSLIEAIAMKEEWFSNKLPHDLDSVDTKDHLQGKLAVEMPELVQTKGKEVERIKSFMSISVDEHRSKFAHRPEIYKRQCMFFGSTNEKHYLKDETGNRRYWPLDCGDNEVRLDLAKELLPQVYAEAMVALEAGEPWWFKSNDEMMIAQQEARTIGEDTWVTNIRKWVKDNSMGREYVVTMAFLIERALGMEKAKVTKGDQTRFGFAIRNAGGVKGTRRIDNHPTSVWIFNHEENQAVNENYDDEEPF